MPIIIYLTLFAERVWLFYIIIITINVVLLLLNLKSIQERPINLDVSFNEDISEIRLDYAIIKLSIALFRSSVFIITSIAIFAVDFRIFPEILKKTNMFGISLMDLGLIIN